MSKPKKTKKSKRGQPRPRVAPFWRSRKLQGALVVMLVALAIGGGWRLHQSSWVSKTVERAKWESRQLDLKSDQFVRK